MVRIIMSIFALVEIAAKCLRRERKECVGRIVLAKKVVSLTRKGKYGGLRHINHAIVGIIG